MAISTYYDPKASSFVSRWSPGRGREGTQDELRDEWWLEQAHSLDMPEATRKDRFLAGFGIGADRNRVLQDEEQKEIAEQQLKGAGAGAVTGGLQGLATGNPAAAIE